MQCINSFQFKKRWLSRGATGAAKGVYGLILMCLTSIRLQARAKALSQRGLVPMMHWATSPARACDCDCQSCGDGAG